MRRPVLALALSSIGCMSPEDRGEPRDCGARGEFELELLLPDTGEPELMHGSQGGTHIILDALLTTPDPIDHYEIELLAEAGEPPCELLECAGWTRIGGYATEIDAASEQVRVLGPDAIELANLFLVVDRWDAAPLRRVTLEVGDACGRHDITTQVFD